MEQRQAAPPPLTNTSGSSKYAQTSEQTNSGYHHLSGSSSMRHPPPHHSQSSQLQHSSSSLRYSQHQHSEMESRWSGYEASPKIALQSYEKPTYEKQHYQTHHRSSPTSQKRSYADQHHHYASRDEPSTPKRARSHQWAAESREGYDYEQIDRRSAQEYYSTRERDWHDDPNPRKPSLEPYHGSSYHSSYEPRDHRLEPRVEQRMEHRFEPRHEPRIDHRLETRMEIRSERVEHSLNPETRAESRMEPPAQGYSHPRRRSGSDAAYYAPRDVSRSFSDDRSINTLDRDRTYIRLPPSSPGPNLDQRPYTGGRSSSGMGTHSPRISAHSAPALPRYLDPLPPPSYRGTSSSRYEHHSSSAYQGRDDQETLMRGGSTKSRGGERIDIYERSPGGYDREGVPTRRPPLPRDGYYSTSHYEDRWNPPGTGDPSSDRRPLLALPPPLHLRSPRHSPADLREASSSSTHGTHRDMYHHQSSRPSLPSIVPYQSLHHPRRSSYPPEMSMAGHPRHSTDQSVKSLKEGRLLLAMKEDRMSLSEALCIIRENVEVFKATQRDVDAPAPGRKNAVLVGQVGLRCIHCLTFSERVKRAVCYPSSIRRIYRTITDMKLDHFSACPGVPRDVKDRLDELKIVSSRSTGTTMRYFVESATKMGMMDAENGVRFKDGFGEKLKGSETSPAIGSIKINNQSANDDPPPLLLIDTSHHKISYDKQASIQSDSTPTHRNSGSKMDNLLSTSARLLGKIENKTDSTEFNPISSSLSRQCSTSDEDEKNKEATEVNPNEIQNSKSYDSKSDTPIISIVSSASVENVDPQNTFTGKILLSQPEDKFMLSPLRCFLREQVYAFSAAEADIAARTPSNFSVVLGQVGICCKHCFKLPPRDRINRAVCFPFSVDRIYQSVADMQRFHFNVCKEVPQDVRDSFETLKSASSKGSKGLATRQYWVTSAKKCGLIDTPTGIKFGRDPHAAVGNAAVSLDILAQVAVDLTKRKPLVLDEDRPLIADFLYVVMQQVQRCTFSEMDKNKRRNKEVGSVGVECRHCVGQPTSRKFFWASVSAVESNFISLHTHLMECPFVPKEVTEELTNLKSLRKEQTAKLKSGSQKAFFARVWKRLHEDDEDDDDDDEEDSQEYDVDSTPASKFKSRSTPSPFSPERLSSKIGHDVANKQELFLEKDPDEDETNHLAPELRSSQLVGNLDTVGEASSPTDVPYKKDVNIEFKSDSQNTEIYRDHQRVKVVKTFDEAENNTDLKDTAKQEMAQSEQVDDINDGREMDLKGTVDDDGEQQVMVGV